MAPRVLVSDELSETAVQIFRDRGVEVDYLPKLGKDKEALAAVIDQYDGLAIRSATKATEKLLEKASRLKVIGRAGIGVDNVDIPAASKKGIIVMNTPFGNSITTAEHAIALMFALARQIPEANAQTQQGLWPKNGFMGVEVTGKTLGLIGAGNIGSIVASRALGLKMALSSKAQNGLVVVDTLDVADAKTKALVGQLAKAGFGKKVLVVDGEQVNEGFARAARNIVGINVLPAVGANVYDILKHDTLVLTRAAVEKLEARFNG